MKGHSTFVLVAMGFGFAFLYLPIVLVVLYSFNDSRLVTVWGGFSLRWYGQLLRSGDVLEAAWLSLRIAATSASAATVLGTLAGFALARLRRLPRVGESFQCAGWRFEIVDVDGRRIDKVLAAAQPTLHRSV